MMLRLLKSIGDSESFEVYIEQENSLIQPYMVPGPTKNKLNIK